MQVIVNSLMTQYQRSGKGRTVVLLHGWADSSAGLAGLAEVLSKHYDVIVPDLPGFGGTAPPPVPWGLNQYVNFINNFLQKIGVQKVHAFIGHSNGGAFAIRGLAEEVFKADKLVLIASAGIRDEYKGRKYALRILAKTGKLLTLPLPTGFKKKLRRSVYKKIGSDMLVVEHLQETFKKVVGEDVRPDAAQLALPVLMIYGEQDGETPVWYGEQFKELMTDSILEILPGAGHFVHLDRPDDVHKATLEFLR